MQFADKLNDNKENVSLFSSNIYDQLLISGAQISDLLCMAPSLKCCFLTFILYIWEFFVT